MLGGDRKRDNLNRRERYVLFECFWSVRFYYYINILYYYMHTHTHTCLEFYDYDFDVNPWMISFFFFRTTHRVHCTGHECIIIAKRIKYIIWFKNKNAVNCVPFSISSVVVGAVDVIASLSSRFVRFFSFGHVTNLRHCSNYYYCLVCGPKNATWYDANKDICVLVNTPHTTAERKLTAESFNANSFDSTVHWNWCLVFFGGKIVESGGNFGEMAEVKVCFVCKMTETDEINYGKWERIKNIDVHHFCLVSVCDETEPQKSPTRMIKSVCIYRFANSCCRPERIQMLPLATTCQISWKESSKSVRTTVHRRNAATAA